MVPSNVPSICIFVVRASGGMGIIFVVEETFCRYLKQLGRESSNTRLPELKSTRSTLLHVDTYALYICEVYS